MTRAAIQFLLVSLLSITSSLVTAQTTEKIETLDDFLKLQKELFSKLNHVLYSEAFVGDIELYEGLPHQTWTRELLDSELKKYNSFTSNKFSFYRSKMTLSSADARSLKAHLLTRENYRQYSGPKWCGGYHPDFMLRFKKGQETVTIYLCFGCGEARIVKDDTFIYCDLKNDYLLESILEDYYHQRPDKQRYVLDLINHMETNNINASLLSKTTDEKWMLATYKIISDSLVEFSMSNAKSKETILCEWDKTLNQWFIINRDTKGERKDDLPEAAEKLKIPLIIND